MKGDRLVFLLGAGRSGTTLLYKILAAHRAVGYLSQYQVRFPRFPALALLHRVPNIFSELKRHCWFLEDGGAYFKSRGAPLCSLVPAPAEAEPVYRSCGMPLPPPQDYLPSAITAHCLSNRFEKLRRYSGAQVLLTKRTGNNRRIPQLNHIFPSAKYIHLVRDGRAVAYSLPRVFWWGDHPLFWADSRTPKQMVEGGADPLEIAARNWVEGMKSIEQGIRFLSPDAVFQVRYEDLLKDPNSTVARILNFIMVDSHSDPRFLPLLRWLNVVPRKDAWPEAWSPEQVERVLTVQREMLERWGYLS